MTSRMDETAPLNVVHVVPPGQGGPQGVQERLSDLVLGGQPKYTRSEVAELSGLTLDQAQRLWRAMGFSDVGDSVAFTDADLSALRRMAGLVASGIIDWDAAVDVARSLGRTTSKLAEWQVDTYGRMLTNAGMVGLDLDDPVSLEVVERDARILLPALERLLRYVWRRELAAAVQRTIESFTSTDTDLAPDTVGFADLVGFTRLSRRLDERELAALVTLFEGRAADVIASSGARLVKTLGDEVMFQAPSAAQAAETAVRLHEVFDDDEQVQLRIGLTTGPVINRMGDIFGPTVNLASRLTALARPEGTLVDAATAAALKGERRYSVRQLPPRAVRGFGMVSPYSLRPTSETD